MRGKLKINLTLNLGIKPIKNIYLKYGHVEMKHIHTQLFY